jgi:hypothetical protein
MIELDRQKNNVELCVWRAPKYCNLTVHYVPHSRSVTGSFLCHSDITVQVSSNCAYVKLSFFRAFMWYGNTVLALGTRQLYALATLFLWKEFTVAVGDEVGWASEPVWTSYSVDNQFLATELLDSYQKQHAYMCINLHSLVYIYLSVTDLFNENLIFY